MRPPLARGSLALGLALAVALVGCIRLGSGDDLHLVCEEKSGSPRKAYDVGFLVAQTRVSGQLADKDRVAMLEAARAHVITMGGRPHGGFTALLSQEEDVWRFEAVGGRANAEPDLYNVTLSREGASWVAWRPIKPPASVLAPAWSSLNATDVAAARFENATTDPYASWDPRLPSCVSFEAEDARAVVNVVQGRVVFVE